MIIPAAIVGDNRCPRCGCIRLSIREYMVEDTILDPNGFPIDTYQYGESYMQCGNCHSKYLYLGNGIDGFSIDDGVYTDEPEFEKQSVVINPFYRSVG